MVLFDASAALTWQKSYFSAGSFWTLGSDMKRLITILLLAIFSVSFTEAGQLLKLPLLFEHYLDHRASNELSLSEFLYDHYVKSHPDDGDEEKDSRLPFKTATSISALQACAPESFWNWAPSVQYFEGSFSLYQTRTLIMGSLSGVFHPPRFV